MDIIVKKPAPPKMDTGWSWGVSGLGLDALPAILVPEEIDLLAEPDGLEMIQLRGPIILSESPVSSLIANGGFSKGKKYKN